MGDEEDAQAVLLRLTAVADLPPDIQKKAEEELNEKLQWRDRDIQALKDMILANASVRGCMEPGFLLRFLRARKFDYDRALALYMNFYRMKQEHPDVFADFSPASISHVVSSGIIGVMPQPDQHGHRILMFRAGVWEPENCPTIDLIKANLICVEHLLTDPTFQVNGLALVIDLANFGFRHANQFGIRIMRMGSRFMQDCTPVRLKAIHFVNEPTVFGYVFTILRPFLTEKMQNRLFFHGSNLASLHKHLAPELLPSNASVGGTGPSVPVEGYMEELIKLTKYFHSMSQFRLETPTDNIAEVEESVEAVEEDAGMLNMGCAPRQQCDTSQ